MSVRSIGRLLAIFVVALSSSACSTPRPTPLSQAEKDALAGQWKACLVANVGRLDDHQSDARTIAEGLAQVCYREYRAWAEGFSDDLPNHAARDMFLQRVDAKQVNMIVPIVLRNRSRAPSAKN